MGNGTPRKVGFTVGYIDPGSSGARFTQPTPTVDVTISAGKAPDLSHNDNVAPVSGQQYLTAWTTQVTTSAVSGTVTATGSPLPDVVVGIFDVNGNPQAGKRLE